LSYYVTAESNGKRTVWSSGFRQQGLTDQEAREAIEALKYAHTLGAGVNNPRKKRSPVKS
jgi:hypothetical protein